MAVPTNHHYESTLVFFIKIIEISSNRHTPPHPSS